MPNLPMIEYCNSSFCLHPITYDGNSVHPIICKIHPMKKRLIAEMKTNTPNTCI